MANNIIKSGMVGRPRISVTPQILADIYSRVQNWDLVASELGISRTTLFRRLNEFGMKRRYEW